MLSLIAQEYQLYIMNWLTYHDIWKFYTSCEANQLLIEQLNQHFDFKVNCTTILNRKTFYWFDRRNFKLNMNKENTFLMQFAFDVRDEKKEKKFICLHGAKEKTDQVMQNIVDLIGEKDCKSCGLFLPIYLHSKKLLIFQKDNIDTIKMFLFRSYAGINFYTNIVVCTDDISLILSDRTLNSLCHIVNV